RGRRGQRHLQERLNGISLDATSSNCTVLGNRIGTNVAGTAALANGQHGIVVDGTGHTIGGTAAGARNQISGNAASGLVLSGSGHQVLGNWIGLDAAGTGAIGNGGYGIRGYSVASSAIGGLASAAGNVIAGNSRGVSFEFESHHNSMLNNIV